MQGHVPGRVQQLQPEEAGAAGSAAGSAGHRLDAQGQAHCLNLPGTFSESLESTSRDAGSDLPKTLHHVNM